jgi:hypothetical protein
MKASQEWMKTKIEDNHQRLYTRMKAYWVATNACPGKSEATIKVSQE